MRPIKFQYIFQHEEKGNFCSIVFDYLQVFNGECKAMCEMLTGYAVVAKRLFTGLHDKNGIEIYEGDLIKDTSGNGIEIYEGDLIKDTSGNGIEIYEGDLIKDTSGNIAKVTWGDFGWKIEFQDITQDPEYINHWGEVIGNIYENKELLNS